MNWVADHESLRFENGELVDGDVHLPFTDLIPGAFGDNELNRIDRLKEFEILSLLAINTLYKGGSVAPTLVWLNDWANAPSMAWFFFVDYYWTNNLIFTPGFKIFTTFGQNNVNDPWNVGRSKGRSELQFRATYQF